MHPCPECGSHVRRADRSCPHCGTRIGPRPARTAAAALLGLTMACSGKDGATTDSGTTTSGEPEYGVTITGDADTDIDTDADADSDADSDTGPYTSGSGATGGVDYGVPYTYGGSGSTGG